MERKEVRRQGKKEGREIWKQRGRCREGNDKVEKEWWSQKEKKEV